MALCHSNETVVTTEFLFIARLPTCVDVDSSVTVSCEGCVELAYLELRKRCYNYSIMHKKAVNMTSLYVQR